MQRTMTSERARRSEGSQIKPLLRLDQAEAQRAPRFFAAPRARRFTHAKTMAPQTNPKGAPHGKLCLISAALTTTSKARHCRCHL